MFWRNVQQSNILRASIVKWWESTIDIVELIRADQSGAQTKYERKRFVSFYFLFFFFFELSLHTLAMAIVLEKRLEYYAMLMVLVLMMMMMKSKNRTSNEYRQKWIVWLAWEKRRAEMKRYRNAHSWTFHKTFHSFAVIKFIIDDAFFRAFSNCLISFLLAYVEFVDEYLNTKRERMNKWISVHARRERKRERARGSLPIGTIYLIWVPFIDTEKISFESNEISLLAFDIIVQTYYLTEAENIHYRRFRESFRALTASPFLSFISWLFIKVGRNNETMYHFDNACIEEIQNQIHAKRIWTGTLICTHNRFIACLTKTNRKPCKLYWSLCMKFTSETQLCVFRTHQP